MSNQVRRIEVKGTITGDADIRKMANALDSVNKSTANIAKGFNNLKGLTSSLVGGTILGFGIRELTSISDTMTQLGSKLNIFVGEGVKATAAFSELSKIADETRAPLTSIATIFTRLATATERLGLSTELQLTLTRGLQQSFRVSGATAEEATASTIQFAQALSFGQLRGQELRSVLSQNSALATIFSKAIEGSGKDIYKFAEAGGFTTKFVLKALLENMGAIEEKANKLAPTFEQTLNRAMNQFTIIVKDLNESLGVSNGFASFMDYILKNGDKVLGFFVALGVSAIPTLTKSVMALNFAALLNPVGLLAAALGGLTLLAINVAGGLKQFKAEVITLVPAIFQLVTGIANWALNLTRIPQLLESITGINPFKFVSTANTDLLEFIRNTRAAANTFKSDLGARERFEIPESTEKRLRKLMEETKRLKDANKPLNEQIGELNALFNRGGISASAFADKLKKLEILKLNEEMKKGSISIFKYREEMDKLTIDNLAIKLEAGAISIAEFNEGVNKFKIEELTRKFNEGKLSVEDFNKKMRELKIEGMDQNSMKTGVFKGLNDFINSVGTTSEQVAKVTAGAFNSLEDAIFQATKGSTDSFAKMTEAILDDITKMIIRMSILKPMASAFDSWLSAPSAGGGATGGVSPIAAQPIPFATGGVFEGGVVNSPTLFGMQSNKIGLMGEAGPEAIVPLKRSGNGSLGVAASPTYVNIINNTSSQVETRESTGADGSKTIEVMIHSKVREGIASGQFDRQLSQAFGLSRKGV